MKILSSLFFQLIFLKNLVALIKHYSVSTNDFMILCIFSYIKLLIVCYNSFVKKGILWKGAQRTTSFLKKTPTQVFYCENCEVFKNTYFEEHQRTAASENGRTTRLSGNTCQFNTCNYSAITWGPVNCWAGPSYRSGPSAIWQFNKYVKSSISYQKIHVITLQFRPCAPINIQKLSCIGIRYTLSDSDLIQWLNLLSKILNGKDKWNYFIFQYFFNWFYDAKIVSFIIWILIETEKL